MGRRMGRRRRRDRGATAVTAAAVRNSAVHCKLITHFRRLPDCAVVYRLSETFSCILRSHAKPGKPPCQAAVLRDKLQRTSGSVYTYVQSISFHLFFL